MPFSYVKERILYVILDVILTEALHIAAGRAKTAFEKEEWFTSYLILRCILSSHHGLVFASFTKDKFNFFWWLILKSQYITKQEQCDPCACLPMYCTKVSPKNCRALNMRAYSCIALVCHCTSMTLCLR